MYEFFTHNERLFGLDDAVEYDTATPYRYAVGKFVELAERIQNGHPVTVITQKEPEKTIVLQTIPELMQWITQYFKGFDQFVQQGVNQP